MDESVPAAANTLPSDPRQAEALLFEDMQSIAMTHHIADLPRTADEMATLLTTVAKVPDAPIVFRGDQRFRELGVPTAAAARNLLPRQLHERLFHYFQRQGISIGPSELHDVQQYFRGKDETARRTLLNSYATNGVLTLSSALRSGVLRETSATPGDFSSGNIEEASDLNDHTNIRGYEVQGPPLESELFYGSNGFLSVAMERGGEDINRASQLPVEEVENRAHASMIFLVRPDKLALSRRHENVHQEDIVSHDIPPTDIDYILVPEAHATLAQECFAHLPATVVPVADTKAEIQNLYAGPYTVPDYQGAVEQITGTTGPIWCHIARLPVDTYPAVREAILE